MLRTIVLASVLGLGFAGAAYADQAPSQTSVVGMRVATSAGTTNGRVTSVQRDSTGRIVSAEIAGLDAPADAPPHVMAPRPRPAPQMMVQSNTQVRVAENRAVRAFSAHD